VSTRANVATMFANIARRTQTLVGRQLQLIDELERDERDPQLLERLYQLDHVATRMRRSADSLLVPSGTIDQTLSSTPTRLTDVIRAALAEIEGYRAVELGQISEVAVVADVVGDLRLLLAELLENATNFSPPGSPVQVSAVLDQDCRIAVVDHGLGMSPARLIEENRRLVERERLDVAPTRVLGLFVVGRLARRHGLAVQLEMSAGRGLTATVRIPVRLLSPVPGYDRPVAPATHRQAPGLDLIPPLAIEAIQSAARSGPFPWLGGDSGLVAIEGAPAAPPPEAQEIPTRTWPPAPRVGGDTVADVTSLPRRTIADQLNGRVAESAAWSEQTTSPLSRGGLSQRIPGTHLAEGVRDAEDPPMLSRTPRDPEAEREELNDYLSGFARVTDDPEPEPQARPTLAERHS
jgi:anti-sigma regulatory factor (Ser/Thr protein kinase)